MVVSGGQTGVDRAALDWAIERSIPHGGWCPLGRKAEDGPIADRYQLRETQHASYKERTARNVVDSDGTLILNIGALDGGTLRTADHAKNQRKPFLVIDLATRDMEGAAAAVLMYLKEARIGILNIAGPRESKRPGVYRLAYDLLTKVG